jgi:hypothetical protein
MVGIPAWLLSGIATLLTTLLAIVSVAIKLPLDVASWIGGLQSFLLLIFASAVQAVFLEMLGLPGTVGRALLESNRGLWGLAILGTTFLFYHTLLNPQGNLAAALRATNVRVFLATVAGFTIFAVAVWLYFKRVHPESSALAGSGGVE